MPPHPDLLSITQTAVLLGVTTTTVRRYVLLGLLPCVTIPRGLHQQTMGFRREDVDAFRRPKAGRRTKPTKSPTKKRRHNARRSTR